MTDEWFAGFFDGEGCISGRSYFQPTKYVNHPRVCLQISLTQKDRKVLELIQKHYGGNISDKKKGCSQLRWVSKEGMKRVLLIIAAYGVCKKEQALVGLKFMETMREDNLGSKPLSEETHAIRKELYDTLKELKIVNGHVVS